MREAPPATWLLVRINPSGVKTKPDPLPRASRRSACDCDAAVDAARLVTSILTTAGLTSSAALTTALE